MISPETSRTVWRAGFSLVELLVVMAIIGVLATATLPALRGTMEGINVSGAAELAGAEIALARQTAVSRNLPVDVRIYSHDDGTGDFWRVLAVVIPSAASGKPDDEWITPGKVLPGNVIISDVANFSTVLTAPAGVGSPSRGTESGNSSTPRLLRGKPYVGFSFRPDGSTTLASDEPWSLALQNPNGRPAEGKPAANFIAIVLDSLTGRTLVFQP